QWTQRRGHPRLARGGDGAPQVSWSPCILCSPGSGRARVMRRKISAGALCSVVAALLIGAAALGEDATKEVASVKQEKGAYVLAFSPDGKLLLAGDEEGAVSTYELPSLKPKKKLGFASKLSFLAFTTDGKLIVAAEKRAIVVRDAAGEDEPKRIT